MATTIQAVGDKIKLDKGFVSGKDRITVNGDVLFEGKLKTEEAQRLVAGEREYVIETAVASKMMGTISIKVQIYQQSELIHEGLYDQLGKNLSNPAQAKVSGAVHACSLVGAVIGFTLMMVGNAATGVIPGGAIGGAIGGGVGALIGGGIGSLIFGKPR